MSRRRNPELSKEGDDDWHADLWRAGAEIDGAREKPDGTVHDRVFYCNILNYDENPPPVDWEDLLSAS